MHPNVAYCQVAPRQRVPWRHPAGHETEGALAACDSPDRALVSWAMSTWDISLRHSSVTVVAMCFAPWPPTTR